MPASYGDSLRAGFYCPGPFGRLIIFIGEAPGSNVQAADVGVTSRGAFGG